MLKQKFANQKSSNFELSRFLNENIDFSNFLLINEKGENLGLVEKEEGLDFARKSNLDLFCITPYSNPPVCKILDFSRYSYKKKKKNTSKKEKKGGSVKEIKFSFRIGDNDLEIKVKKISKWLEDGDSVKVSFTMWGREQKHKDIAIEKCKKIIRKVEEASRQFQLKDEINLVGNMYTFTFFRNKKVSNKNND